MKVTFCGVRGSTPAPGSAFVRYGGQTSCVAVSLGDDAPHLLLDAGTGLIAVTPLLGGEPFDGSILLGHLHWDHTHGMPFFAGGTALGSRVAIHIPEQGDSAESVLERAVSPPHFPIVPSQLGPGWSFTGLPEGTHALEGYDVLAREIPHKGGRAFGYRVAHGGASLAYLSDHSPTSVGPGPDDLGERHESALALADGVDVLIHDSQHLQAQFPDVQFLGHASVEYGVQLAREAGAKAYALFHHDPQRTDDEVDAILEHARGLAGDDLAVVAAYEGLVLDLTVPIDQHTEGASGAPAVRFL
ncbi:hypothetical protein H5V45_00075 [Nocardioides sp. KIGAM211]|uniref:Metallo-beta-lactamase domain-containing protein n=1 Tax=Nocardioides luti TaxID=2761101 RepID=A0A7X0RCC0_9ACTN|nr:MBL fold metallo-hydrolase [Nocardioides luti]MBB6625702.1 hypothetical protein [Nocardioides luti]